MKKFWSKHWKSSKQPRKQRKYIYNAPLHIRQKFISAHLSKELIKKYSKRSMPVKKGDKVKIVRGQFKGKIGAINRVNLKKSVAFVEGAEQDKRDGKKAPYPIHTSNMIILSLELGDKKRERMLKGAIKPKETKI